MLGEITQAIADTRRGPLWRAWLPGEQDEAIAAAVVGVIAANRDKMVNAAKDAFNDPSAEVLTFPGGRLAFVVDAVVGLTTKEQ